MQTGKKRKKNILFFQKSFLLIVYYPYSYYFYLKKFVGFIFTLAATGREKSKGLPRTSRENLSVPMFHSQGNQQLFCVAN